MRNVLMVLVFLSFLSIRSIALAATPPILTDVPEVVHSGETIRLVGNHLKVDGKVTRVLLTWPDDAKTFGYFITVVPSGSASLNVPFPDLDYDGNMTISVATEAGTSVEKTIRYLPNLQIESISPTAVHDGAQVTIAGNGFHVKGPDGQNLPATIKLNWREAEGERTFLFNVDPQSATSMVFKMPTIKLNGEIQLNVEIAGRASKEWVLTQRSPLFERVDPSEVEEGDTIILHGANFITPQAGGAVLLPKVVMRWVDKDGEEEKRVLQPDTLDSESIKVKLPALPHQGEVRLSVAGEEESQALPIVYRPHPTFLSFDDYQKKYGNLFFRMHLGVESVTVNTAFQKGLPRVGLHLYGVHSSFETLDCNFCPLGKGCNAWGVGFHHGLSAFLTSAGEEVEFDGAPESLGDKRALDVETQFFLPVYTTERKTQLVGPIAVFGSRKVDDKERASLRYYGGLRLARNPLMYADLLFGKTEGRPSKRMEVRGQFPLSNDNVFLGAIGNFSFMDRDDKERDVEDVVRVYVTWNLAPEAFINKFVTFFKSEN